jgi:hypothetical protein
MWKKWFSGFTALAMAASIGFSSVGAAGVSTNAGTTVHSQAEAAALASPSDVKGHWAEAAIQTYVAQGIVQGYEDGSFQPDRTITRAEFVALINKLFTHEVMAEITYSDISENDWFYKDIRKAQQAGYVSGYSDGTFRANDSITRQETAVLLAKLLELPESEAAIPFADTADSPDWSKGAIGAVVHAGLMNGYEGNAFRPESNFTRAEAVTVLERAVAANRVVYDTAGTFGPETGVETVRKDVVIQADNVTLRNLEIEGDLLLDEQIGEGNVTLSNVKVHGTTIIRGGGPNSIHFEDSIMLSVIIDKATGSVRIVANGATQIADVTVQSNAKIEAEEGAKIDNVTLSEALPSNSHVEMVGYYESVNIIATNIVVDIPKGSIKDLNIAEKAGGSSVKVGNEASIISLIVNAATTILGQGNVQNAQINAKGVSMEKAPEKTTIGSQVPADTTVKIGNSDVPVGQTPVPGGNGGGTGGSAGGSGGSTDGGSAGGSDGGSDGNNPDPGVPVNPLPTGDIPVILNAPYRGTVGDSVYVASSMAGAVYIVNYDVTRTLPVLEDAIKVGKGIKQQLTANTVVQGVYSANIDTAALSKSMVDFKIVAVSEGNQLSNPYYIQLFAGPSDPLQFSKDTFGAGEWTNKRIHFNFNKTIVNHLPDVTALKAAVTHSADNGEFVPLSAQDQVEIMDYSLVVTIANSYTGVNNRWKLAAGSIQDKEGNVFSEELVTHQISARPVVSKMSYASVFQAGETIAIRLSMPETVYLIPTGLTWNTRYDLENEVVAKRATKVIIDGSKVDHDVELATEGLAPGHYRIMVFAGNDILVEIR